MKTRQGFVSNSSSSSFIIAVGVVDNMEQVQKFMNQKKAKFDHYDTMLIDGLSDYFENYNDHYRLDCGDWAGYGGCKTLIEKILENDPLAKIVVKEGTGPSEDSWFRCCQCEHCYELDYDKIDLTDFDEIDQDFYEGKVPGLEIVDQFYGAGRNG
jgi:hypothetical protein